MRSSSHTGLEEHACTPCREGAKHPHPTACMPMSHAGSEEHGSHAAGTEHPHCSPLGGALQLHIKDHSEKREGVSVKTDGNNGMVSLERKCGRRWDARAGGIVGHHTDNSLLGFRV